MTRVPNIDDPRYVKAMSHPLRVRILAMLTERKASPVELSQRLDVNLGVVAYHVRTLERLGLIRLVGERRVRGAIEHYYAARVRPRVSDEAWGQAPAIAKQAAIASTLQVVQEYARASADRGGFDRADAQLTRSVYRLDAKGFAQLAQACTRLVGQADKIEQQAAARLAKRPHAEEPVNAALVTMLFESIRLSDQAAPDEGSASPRRRRRAVAPAVSD